MVVDRRNSVAGKLCHAQKSTESGELRNLIKLAQIKACSRCTTFCSSHILLSGILGEKNGENSGRKLQKGSPLCACCPGKGDAWQTKKEIVSHELYFLHKKIQIKIKFQTANLKS